VFFIVHAQRRRAIIVDGCSRAVRIRLFVVSGRGKRARGRVPAAQRRPVSDDAQYVQILDVFQWRLAEQLASNGRRPTMVVSLGVHL